MTGNPLDDFDPDTFLLPDTLKPGPDALKQAKPNQPPITAPTDRIPGDELLRTWGGTRLGERALLTFVVQYREPHAHRFELQVQIDDEFVIGRRHPKDPNPPDVDLAQFGAQELGLSRRHAKFINEDGVLKVADLGSTNGTYINGIPLRPNQPQIMRLGDQLNLGNVLLYLSRIT